LNPEGHWEAVAQFDREEADRHTISYLIGNLHLSADAIEVLQRAPPTLYELARVLVLGQRVSLEEEFMTIWY
jgi:hypothetical protein